MFELWTQSLLVSFYLSKASGLPLIVAPTLLGTYVYDNKNIP
jgi:acyl CoA:acetate/3-ketoacid CoA transferase alpha subunit